MARVYVSSVVGAPAARVWARAELISGLDRYADASASTIDSACAVVPNANRAAPQKAAISNDLRRCTSYLIRGANAPLLIRRKCSISRWHWASFTDC